jgi:hypothetical protein
MGNQKNMFKNEEEEDDDEEDEENVMIGTNQLIGRDKNGKFKHHENYL